MLMATRRPDPTVQRRRLRNELRKARERARMTQREVADAMDWSLSKLIRIETGQVGITTNDLRALLAHYGVNEESRVKELIDSGRASRERSWWSVYKEIAAPEYLTFLGYESSATYLRNFEPIVLPGLLQTEEYAREVVAGFPNASALVELRMERQELIVRDDGPRMYFMLDEAVIRRVVGGPDVMHHQLRKLLDLNKRPNVEIFIVPFSEGVHPLWRTPMVHFEFAGSDDEDVLYIENPIGQLIIREGDPEESAELTPTKYLDLFWTVEHLARKTDAESLIQDALDGLSQAEKPGGPRKNGKGRGPQPPGQ